MSRSAAKTIVAPILGLLLALYRADVRSTGSALVLLGAAASAINLARLHPRFLKKVGISLVVVDLAALTALLLR